MSLTDRLKALVTYSNEKTGKSDATLSDAVKHLAEGYGGGGDITLGSHKVLFGQFTPTAGSSYYSGGLKAPQNTKWLFATFWLDDFSVADTYKAAGQPILLEGHTFGDAFGGAQFSRELRYRDRSGNMKFLESSYYGITVVRYSKTLCVEIYQNGDWPLQAELYNYMVIYE